MIKITNNTYESAATYDIHDEHEHKWYDDDGGDDDDDAGYCMTTDSNTDWDTSWPMRWLVQSRSSILNMSYLN